MELTYINKLVPELNFWVNRTLYNNLFNSNTIPCPTKISDFWRSGDSVIELIFSETADPSGSEYDGYHFIWKYRTINTKKLYEIEPMLHKRVQVYYDRTWIYAAKDDPKFADIFNLSESSVTTGVQDFDYPYGVKPTKYVNYNSHIVGSGTDQLHYDDPEQEPLEPSDDGPVVYAEEENVFGLTDEELRMCENLYYYRTGQYDQIENFCCDYYYMLKSPLSKWIYIYLDCYLYNRVNYDFLYTLCDTTHGTLRCLAEKHFQDRVYEYIQKQCVTLCEDIKDLGVTEIRSFMPYSLGNSTYVYKGRITEDDVLSYSIPIKSIDKQPYYRQCIEFIYDGKIQKYGQDYNIINVGNYSKRRWTLELKDPTKYKIGSKYQIMYNYIHTKIPYTGIKEFDY